MEVIVGTYEEFLVGYSLENFEGKFVLKQSFTNHAHRGSIRSMAASSKYLASGGIDEVIHLCNIKQRKETGTLNAHTGTITALEFMRNTHLFSASEDGNICIWNTRGWQCEKTLRGHKDAVTCISLHSSGKLLISVSKDKTLRTWNLIKGRCAYIVNLKEIAHQVLWSPSCLYFALVFDHRIDVYDIGTGGVVHSLDKSLFDKRINKIIFIDDDHIIISGDGNELVICDVSSKSVVNQFEAHSNRIKDVAWINLKSLEGIVTEEDSQERWLVTTSSDGFIKIWSLDLSNLKSAPKLVAQINTTCRPTCMAVCTSKGCFDKFENFSVPELKISKEELEACKSKLMEKRAKRKVMKEPVVTKSSEEPLPPKRVKVDKSEVSAKQDSGFVVTPMESETRPAQPLEGDEDDDDDEEDIRAMKASSKVLKQMHKFNKNKKRNITTFKMRMQRKKSGANEVRNKRQAPQHFTKGFSKGSFRRK